MALTTEMFPSLFPSDSLYKFMEGSGGDNNNDNDNNKNTRRESRKGKFMGNRIQIKVHCVPFLLAHVLPR
jgi:hypothetical protein